MEKGGRRDYGGRQICPSWRTLRGAIYACDLMDPPQCPLTVPLKLPLKAVRGTTGTIRGTMSSLHRFPLFTGPQRKGHCKGHL